MFPGSYLQSSLELLDFSGFNVLKGLGAPYSYWASGMDDLNYIVLLSISCVFSLIAGAVLSYLAYIAHIRLQYSHIPGPRPSSFIFGNSRDLWRYCRTADEALFDLQSKSKTYADGKRQLKPLVFEQMIKWADEYGDTYILYFFHSPFLVTRCPEAIKTILVHGNQHDFPKAANFNSRQLLGHRYLYDGLVTTVDHDAWHLRRKAVDPVFHRRKLQKSVDTFNVSGDNLVSELQKIADQGETVELHGYFHRATLDVIMRTMFSMDSEHLNTEFHQTAENFVVNTFEAMQKFSILLFQKYNPLLHGYRKKVRDILISFRNIGENLIKERLMLMESGCAVPDDFLTTLINAHRDPSIGYTFDIMVDEFITMVVAGMETSANLLCLLFMEVGRNPELMERLAREVDEVVGSKASITNEDLSKLTFTMQLIKETLRLYPPAPLILRKIKKTTNLGGFKIPGNTLCLVSIAGANRNKRFVNDPLTYNPGRFDPDATTKVPVYAYIPFSLGARNCIGQIFAQMEMRVMIAKFVQHFRFVLDTSETFDLGQHATIYPLSKLKVQLYSRS